MKQQQHTNVKMLQLEDVNALRSLVQLGEETQTLVDARQNKLDHARLSRMRRSVKKHRIRKEQKPQKPQGRRR